MQSTWEATQHTPVIRTWKKSVRVMILKDRRVTTAEMPQTVNVPNG